MHKEFFKNPTHFIVPHPPDVQEGLFEAVVMFVLWHIGPFSSTSVPQNSSHTVCRDMSQETGHHNPSSCFGIWNCCHIRKNSFRGNQTVSMVLDIEPQPAEPGSTPQLCWPGAACCFRWWGRRVADGENIQRQQGFSSIINEIMICQKRRVRAVNLCLIHQHTILTGPVQSEAVCFVEVHKGN